MRRACSISSRIDRGPRPDRRGAPQRVDELVSLFAVAALRRCSSGGGVRVCEQPERASSSASSPRTVRGRDAEIRAFDERPRSHGLARGDVLLDDPPQDLALPRCGCIPFPCLPWNLLETRSAQAMNSAVTPQPKNRPRLVRRSSSPRPVGCHLGEIELREAGQRVSIDSISNILEGDRLVEPQAEAAGALEHSSPASIGSSSRGGATPSASAWMCRGRPGRFHASVPEQRQH